MKYNAVITIRSGCDSLLNMQMNSFKDLNITIIPFKNTTSEGYLLDIIKLQNVEWVMNRNIKPSELYEIYKNSRVKIQGYKLNMNSYFNSYIFSFLNF